MTTRIHIYDRTPRDGQQMQEACWAANSALRQVNKFVSRLTMGALVTALIAACGSVNVRQEPIAPLTEKTVQVDVGSLGLLGATKSELARLGWRQVVYRGPVVRERVSERREVEFDQFSSRMRLVVNERFIDLCLNLEPLYVFDIVMIDNQTGQEALSVSGSACQGRILEEFRKAVAGLPQ